MSKFVQELQEKIQAAARLEHPERLMRVTLECGHFRLMTWHTCSTGGIGWSTACNVCSESRGSQVSRQIVNQEETGVL